LGLTGARGSIVSESAYGREAGAIFLEAVSKPSIGLRPRRAEEFNRQRSRLCESRKTLSILRIELLGSTPRLSPRGGFETASIVLGKGFFRPAACGRVLIAPYKWHNVGLLMNLLGLTYAQLADQFRQRYDKGDFHAGALYRAFFRRPDLDLGRIAAFTAAPRLRRQVQKDLAGLFPRVVDRLAQDGVLKLVLGLADGLRVESVVVPMANHATVCVSSQVGCRMGCAFCRTGRMGWRRDLTAAEIVAQVYTVKVTMGFRVRNVVFMGMGEPLDNFDNLVQAVGVLADQRGLDIAKRHMTISTVGLPRAIERLAALDWPQLKLAISLNAPDDGLRNQLMPINRIHPLDELKSALRAYPLARGHTFFMEYVLIKGVNDHPRRAARLAEFIKDLPVKLNLIPYNPHSYCAFEAPRQADIQRFQEALIDQHIFVRVRASKGAGIRAACGQLGAADNPGVS
jgi:23S rRNA (adenine2503-C2)-methyltransferase